MTARDVEIVRRGDVVVARVDGDIDLANAPLISTQILGGVPNDAIGLVLDLSAVRYIDSVGIRMLFTIVRALKSARQVMAIALDETSPIRKLFKITAIDDAVILCVSEDDCAAALEDRSGLY